MRKHKRKLKQKYILKRHYSFWNDCKVLRRSRYLICSGNIEGCHASYHSGN